MKDFDRCSQRSRLARLAAALSCAALLPAPVAGPLAGGPYAVLGAPGGGGKSAGGNFVIAGWVAAAGAGTSSGDEFDLTCGLIGLYTPPADDLGLQVAWTPDGRVRIWWSPTLVGYQLESVSGLAGGAAWQVVATEPGGNSFITEPDGPARFYRLRKP